MAIFIYFCANWILTIYFVQFLSRSAHTAVAKSFVDPPSARMLIANSDLTNGRVQQGLIL